MKITIAALAALLLTACGEKDMRSVAQKMYDSREHCTLGELQMLAENPNDAVVDAVDAYCRSEFPDQQ